jgi:hypothetical protein
MKQAVDKYNTYRGESDSWMLGRFVLPLTRHSEFEAATNPLPSSTYISDWHLSAICAARRESLIEDFASELSQISDFNQRHNRDIHDSFDDEYLTGFLIDAIEVKANNAAEVRQLAAVLKSTGSELDCFCEVPLNDAMLECLNAIGEIVIGEEARLFAKVRTGGLDASGFPSAHSLLSFIAACHERGISFKATAGLHHPLCGTHPFTYEENSAQGMMHGFLNVFLAAAFISNGMDMKEAAQILDETSLEGFRFEADGVAWRTNRLTNFELRNARLLATSFGSCSFTEPLADLRTLNLL